VSAGGGDFQGAFDGFLSLDFGEVDFVLVGLIENGFEIDLGGGDFEFAFQEAGSFAEVADRDDVESFDDGGFGGIFLRDQESSLAVLAGLPRDGEDAIDRADGPGEGEFADHGEVVQLAGVELFAGGQHADGNGEIETGAFLAHVRRGEVDGGAAHGEFEPGIGQGCGDAVAGFLDSGIGQPHHDDNSIPPSRIDLNLNRIGVNAVDGTR
jgi:hypothetical protein